MVCQDDIAQCYAFPSKNESKSSDAIISATILYDRRANVLFDIGSTNSYVSLLFASKLDMICDILDYPCFYLNWRVSHSHLCLSWLSYFVHGLSYLGKFCNFGYE